MPKRSYFEEIEELTMTWDKMVLNNPIISTMVTPQLLKGTAYCIGSGGSLALAKLWQYVHESNNLGHAKTMTPFEYNYSYLSSDLVILFSASGKNHDILQVFNTAINRGSKVLVFTVSSNSALIRLVSSNPLKAFAVFPTAITPKDGFLAVNSMISMAFLVKYLQEHLFGKDSSSKQSPVNVAYNDHFGEISRLNVTSSINTLQVIASDWGVPASLDLEARSAESGIVSCHVTDPRNFGHGRFIWLEIHKKDMVVLITTPKTYAFYNRLRNLLPDYVTCYNINSPVEGLLGAIYCITRAILLFGELSKTRDIDPGKPEVPEWGKRIHRLQLGAKELVYPKNKTANMKKEYPALRLNFSAVVMDIDGTLIDTRDRFGSIGKEIGEELNRLIHSGVKFGFSTGRGKSALKILKEHIPEKLWSEILVGLYNGTQLVYLSDDINSIFIHKWPIHKLVAATMNDACKDCKELVVECRPTQVSITGLTKDQGEIVCKQLFNRLGQHARFIKVLASGHSIDILPYWASKLSVVEAISVGLDDNVLCIGDQGQVGGNDEELLSWSPSVSVGSKRPVSNDCLWLGLHPHLRESAGTLKLLRAIEKKGQNFTIDHKKIYC